MIFNHLQNFNSDLWLKIKHKINTIKMISSMEKVKRELKVSEVGIIIVINPKLIKSKNVNDRKFVLIYNGKYLEYHKAVDFISKNKLSHCNDGDIVIIK